MNLQTFISTYNGETVGSGQCGDLVDLWLVDGFGNHTSYATALDYWTNGIPGFSVTTDPQPGDIACYNSHPGYPDGHIAIYDGAEVFEQNADPDGSPAHLFARADTYLLGYLTGGSMETIPTAEYQDLLNWKAAFQPVTFTAQWTNAGGTGGAPIPNVSSNFTNIIADDAKYSTWVKAQPAWLADGNLADLSIVKTGSEPTPTVVVNGVTYVPQS